MQIDLFKDQNVTKDMNRLLKQVETRAFCMNCDETVIQEVCGENKQFYAYVMALADKTREYTKRFDCSTDSHFALEAMGLGKDTKQFIVMIDLSSCFDYVLHRLTGCPIEAVKAIANYERVSTGFLNSNYEALQNFTIGSLMSIDNSIDDWIVRLLREIDFINDLSDREKLNLLLSKIHRNILTETNRLKNYIAMYLRANVKQFIIRSKYLAGVIATTDTEIDTQIELIESARTDIQPYSFNLRLLKKFEFYTGGVIDAFSWVY